MENDHKGGNKTKLKASDIYSDDSGSSDSAEEEEEAKPASQRRSSSSESRDSDSDNDKKSVICLFYAQNKIPHFLKLYLYLISYYFLDRLQVTKPNRKSRYISVPRKI